MNSAPPTLPPHRARQLLREATGWHELLQGPQPIGQLRALLGAVAADGAWDVALPMIADRARQTAMRWIGGAQAALDREALGLLDAWLLEHTPSPLAPTHLRAFTDSHAALTPGLVAFLPRFWAREAAQVSVETWMSLRPEVLRDAVALGWSRAPFDPTTWRARWAAATRYPQPTLSERHARAGLVQQWRSAGAPATPAPSTRWPDFLAHGGDAFAPAAYRLLLRGAGPRPDALPGPATERHDLPGVLALLEDPVALLLWAEALMIQDHSPGLLLMHEVLGPHIADPVCQAALIDALHRLRARTPRDAGERQVSFRLWGELEHAVAMLPQLDPAIREALTAVATTRREGTTTVR